MSALQATTIDLAIALIDWFLSVMAYYNSLTGACRSFRVKLKLTGRIPSEDAMKARPDCVSISSVLFTIALLCFVPVSWNSAFSRHDGVATSQLDDGFREAAVIMSYVGFASLAIILIGLIVLWTGYIKRSRSAWLVMFIVVWLWAFPLFILPIASPIARGYCALTLSEWLYDAISRPGLTRDVMQLALIFSLMVLALLLPIRRFFGARGAEEPIYRPSAKFLGFLMIGVLVVVVALYAWIRVGVVYKIPVTELNSTQRLPPPPPPPTWK